MKQIDKEVGKQMIDNYFQIGKWYKCDSHCGNFNNKYFRLEKINHKYDERVFLKGTGFTELNGKLLNPTVAKEECICYVWANEYIGIHIIEVSEDIVKEAFDIACKNIKENLFN